MDSSPSEPLTTMGSTSIRLTYKLSNRTSTKSAPAAVARLASRIISPTLWPRKDTQISVSVIEPGTRTPCLIVLR